MCLLPNSIKVPYCDVSVSLTDRVEGKRIAGVDFSSRKAKSVPVGLLSEGFQRLLHLSKSQLQVSLDLVAFYYFRLEW